MIPNNFHSVLFNNRIFQAKDLSHFDQNSLPTPKGLGKKKSSPQFEVNKKLFLRIMHPKLIVFSFLQIDIFKLSEIFYT